MKQLKFNFDYNLFVFFKSVKSEQSAVALKIAALKCASAVHCPEKAVQKCAQPVLNGFKMRAVAPGRTCPTAQTPISAQKQRNT